MATLTANAKAAALQFQRDGITNRAEAPNTGNIAGGTGTVIGADGSTAVVTSGGVGQAPNIFTIPQPGKGFPTGKTATHTTGTYPRLTDPTIQQATDSTPSTLVSSGLSVTADPNAGSKNALQNWIPSVPAAQGTGGAPTQSTFQQPAAGVSIAPQSE